MLAYACDVCKGVSTTEHALILMAYSCGHDICESCAMGHRCPKCGLGISALLDGRLGKP